MGRPASTRGGRPHVVSVRLSDEEKAALDDARGGLKPGDYLRSLIPDCDPAPDGFVPPHIKDRLPQVYADRPDPVITDFVPGPVEVHRHRRGKLISEGFHKGQRIDQYACAVEGCTEVLS